MAQLVFLREGNGPERIASSRKLPAKSILAGIGARKANYAGTDVPTLPTNRPALTGVRGPSHVVVCISSQETGGIFHEVGCYLLEGIAPTEANKWK